jgi:hypothetical protein
MSADVGPRRESFVRPTAAILGTLAAGLLPGYALTAAGLFEVRYIWAGVGAAVPAALAMAIVAAGWPRQAALGIIALLVFSAALLARATLARAPEPLLVAGAAVILIGSVAVLTRRARPLDILAGLVLGYASAAFIYEISIVLHNV